MIRTRIAPTPSGYLHLGNACSFLLTWLLARSQGGSIQLRIDDIDSERSRVKFIEDIFRNLEWLGIDWDEGPEGVQDFQKNYSQALFLDEYQDQLNNLKLQKKLFACTCSRKEILQINPKGDYPGTCHYSSLSFDNPRTAWRIFTPKPIVHIPFNNLGSSISNQGYHRPDFIVRTKRGRAAYHLVSLWEDLKGRVNTLVRGMDLYSSTQAQLYLSQHILQGQAFQKAHFLHHPLIYNQNGQKLSKSASDTSLKEIRNQGHSAKKVWDFFADFAKLPKVDNPQKWLDNFKVENLNWELSIKVSF